MANKNILNNDEEQVVNTFIADTASWINVLNRGDNQLCHSIYHSQAVKMFTPDSLLLGRESICQYYNKLLNPHNSFELLFSTLANRRKSIYYELYSSLDNDSLEYVHLLIWNTENNNPVIEFEMSAPLSIESSQDFSVLEEIEQRRLTWMDLCNRHQTRQLIEQMYTPNTLYFSHKPLVQGTEALIEEYRYMSKETYSLQLKTLVSQILSDQYILEIGQCQGSYSGKYILLWHKDQQGQWRIAFDSNV